MSEENVERLRRGLAAWNRRDVEALVEMLDPAVEWYPALDVLLGGEATVYRGHEGVRELFANIDETLDALEAEMTEIRDLGDRLVAVGQMRARGRQSGAEITSPVGLLVELRNGRMLTIRTFLEPAEAFEAAGAQM